MTDTFVQHCITVYNAVDDRARLQVLDSGKKARVFAGSYTEAFSATGLSRTYYTSTRKALEKHNAFLFLQRGGRSADTVIVLRGLPKKWEIDGWNDGGLTKPSEYATLRVDLEELRKLLGGINVTRALAEFEKRVIALETQVAEIQKALKSKTKSTK